VASISATPVASISATPNPTPSNIPFQINIDWSLKGDGGGQGRLEIIGNDSTVYLDQLTPGSFSTISGTVYIPQGNLPYTVTGSWWSGSGNHVAYRICRTQIGLRWLEYDSSDIYNMNPSDIWNSGVSTPWYVSIQMISSLRTLDACLPEPGPTPSGA
jgi:hypothetical protein